MEQRPTVLTLGRLLVVFLVIGTTWYAVNRRTLAALDEAYRERQSFRTRVAELSRELRSLDKERRELARGGFPAERALREVYHYARSDEFVARIGLDEKPANSADSR